MASINNLLFKSLSDEDRALLEPHFSLGNFPQRHVFEEPGKPIKVVCFPESLVGSIVAKQGDLLIEIGLIGCEGMSGMALVMGNARAVHSTFVQIAGEGNVISADALRRALDQSPTMRSAFLRYFQVQVLQTAHTAIANSIGKLPQRLARWLLMAHDRVKGDELVLTHEFLSLMLAVRRSGVTEAINALEEKKLISCVRGRVQVLNRKGLEKAAAEFYGKPEAEYRRLMKEVNGARAEPATAAEPKRPVKKSP
jgi:CRP-like cAMP-binding protein